MCEPPSWPPLWRPIKPDLVIGPAFGIALRRVSADLPALDAGTVLCRASAQVIQVSGTVNAVGLAKELAAARCTRPATPEPATGAQRQVQPPST